MTTVEQIPVTAAPRCCAVHPTINVLAEHLILDFPDLGANQVLAALIDAHRACDSVGIPYFEVLETIEVVTRHVLTEHKERHDQHPSSYTVSGRIGSPRLADSHLAVGSVQH